MGFIFKFSTKKPAQSSESTSSKPQINFSGDYVAGDKNINPQKTSDEITPEEKTQLAPRIIIKLFSLPEIATTEYKPPLKQYILLLQNTNQSSASVCDFRAEFHFPFRVIETVGAPLANPSDGFGVGPIEIHTNKPDGTTSLYKELPMESSFAKNFSFGIVKAKINTEEVNTNIVFLTSERLPLQTAFQAKIIIDTSKKPVVLKNPNAVGQYNGIYFYKIKNQLVSENFSGKISN